MKHDLASTIYLLKYFWIFCHQEELHQEVEPGSSPLKTSSQGVLGCSQKFWDFLSKTLAN